MLKQYRELSMFVCRTIKTNEEAGIRPSKTYQLFVAAVGSHRELSFIEKDVRNYITQELRNVSEQHDTKEFGKYLLRMKEKNQNFYFKLNLEGYDLGGNKWLLELYEDRHIWIPVYLDHHFWARMRNTQRSESMHAFFDKFITRNSSQSQFVKQYDNCLASREQREREFDAADFHTVIPCATKSAIEVQFQHVYIHKKFREVQGQFRGKVNCITRSMHSTLGFTTYEVVEQLNLLDGGPTIQSSSSFYNAPDMNYTR
ncbi:hypothetical protein Ahy_B06g084690 [Arachis hypogaea]|uniref:Protein FAR1-RELATED SEQUENCE n=1 Tax=Arachis hypogaea TaxID=3818 RepID=A0A444YSJ9_ARAHY|nr:hypothetical protein Ahy_B06g084690 [Arachis hypogaea]